MLPHAMLFDYELVNFRVQLNKVTLEYIFSAAKGERVYTFQVPVYSG
jgi:hypothetical protein